MKRILFAVLGAMIVAGIAYAAQGTRTPIVPPTETGEDSLHQQEVFNMARIKPGMGTLAVTVSGSAASGTLNTASGIITSSATTAGASGATPSVITLTNSKVQAGDIVICEVDQTGATAGSVLQCNPHVTANTIAFSIYSATPTALTSSTVVLYYVVLTAGNPN